jgi:phosphatidylinositol-3-phosphatase
MLTCGAAFQGGDMGNSLASVRGSALLIVVGAILCGVTGPSQALGQDRRSYQHIVVIIEENRAFDDIIGSPMAPNLTALANQYGLATRFFAETHPSEPNYVAILGGSTFGITDDDAYYCRFGSRDENCSGATRPGYPDHTIVARSLMDQLAEHGLTWRGYFESIPSPGSRLAWSPQTADQPAQLYASKHNGFMNFARVQNDPQLATHIVGFDRLKANLASGNLPNYAQIVPNQCNDMHGLGGANVPRDCVYSNNAGLIARGDTVAGELVQLIQASPVWSSTQNVAIVITWDENDGAHHADDPPAPGCCGYDPNDPANAGGGRIATIVITNHGPRGVTDNTPYNHYSLLRTTEDAFGIAEHLRAAGETARGVRSMDTLFGLP